MSENVDPSAVPQQVFLLRHGEVDSHRGDVPITASGAEFATEVGRSLARASVGPILLLTGETRRTRETAEALHAGASQEGADLVGPRVASALRNPDLYVAGQRVNMVSSVEALAAQLDDVDDAAAARSPFFQGFLEAGDRIGYWIRHPEPPGDDAAVVAGRIRAFAASFAEVPQTRIVVAVTHSPVLRAVALAELGRDIGEPPWVAGLRLDVTPNREVRATILPKAP